MVEKKKMQQILKALGGEMRLEIFKQLKRKRSASVSDLALIIHRSVATTSIHLSHLERLNIVKRRRRGQEVYYRLAVSQDPLVKQVLKAL